LRGAALTQFRYNGFAFFQAPIDLLAVIEVIKMRV